jgi:hypothetical protein
MIFSDQKLTLTSVPQTVFEPMLPTYDCRATTGVGIFVLLECGVSKNVKRKGKVNLSVCLTKCRDILCLSKHDGVETYGGVEVQLHAFLTSVLGGGEWSASRPGRRNILRLIASI